MYDMIFSWAEDANGKMVHMDSVRQGLKCGCTCPCCHETLQARQGEIRSHGFAHHSDNRGANLKICYMVIMYKLAEQIIQQEKKIHIPSYYGIFKERDIEFAEVVVDSRYDWIDKQPDVIATTVDGVQYLIEFTFDYKVQHKEKVDYEKLNCIEIDLSSQTLESLHNFLMQSNDGKRWINHQTYFESIESECSRNGKTVEVKDESVCSNCDLKDECCGIRQKGQSAPIIIENSGHFYRVCKVTEYNESLKQLEKVRRDSEWQRHWFEQWKAEEYQEKFFQEAEINCHGTIRTEDGTRERREQEDAELIETSKIDSESRTCFMCKRNLDWMYRNDGYAHCGPYISLGVPKNTPPDMAKTCKGFIVKSGKR